MIFAVSPDMGEVLLLRKPNDHKNPLFRGRWTGPGGKIEDGETQDDAARREMREETTLDLSNLRFILSFRCDCDPTEEEHDVAVYGALVSQETMRKATGFMEPVAIFRQLPNDLIWYVPPVLEMVKFRLAQAEKGEK